ncbi:MAG: aminopeptidase [Oligoflexia bacterium]|nr:aminopeptidase [Oligoflexia bacterium]MBF0366905.1 aminopeptidase [Oligoflexia bacterium]
MNEQLLLKYADLILKNGVHLLPGQNLVIRGEPIHWPFINLLAKRAYQIGANQIRFDVFHPTAHVYRTLYQRKEYLPELPTYTQSTVDAYINEHWARINLEGSEDPEFFKDANQENNAVIQKAASTAMRPVLNASMKGDCTWTIAPVPTPKWAAKVLKREIASDSSSESDLVHDYWKVLIPILRLDHEDPCKAWKEHSNKLKSRLGILNQMQITHLHYETADRKTDLTIVLADDGQWCGGDFSAHDGRPFLPNIPTEEVFSCPHRLKTRGRVQVTRPVKIFGEEIVGASFTFEEGRVVAFDAEKGRGLLEKYFAMDENARCLGEVALVDGTSPIYKANLIFDSILLDENASCHIALGNGIMSAIRDGARLTPEELKSKGWNSSILHTDFMIGSNDLKITAHTRSQGSIVIMRDGLFVF